jgi:hypothetical protein
MEPLVTLHEKRFVHTLEARLVEAWTTTGILSGPLILRPNPFVRAPTLIVVGRVGFHKAVGTPWNDVPQPSVPAMK